MVPPLGILYEAYQFVGMPVKITKIHTSNANSVAFVVNLTSKFIEKVVIYIFENCILCIIAFYLIGCCYKNMYDP